MRVNSVQQDHPLTPLVMLHTVQNPTWSYQEQTWNILGMILQILVDRTTTITTDLMSIKIIPDQTTSNSQGR